MTKKIIIAIILIIVLVGLGFGGYYMFMRDDNQTAAPINTNTNTNTNGSGGGALPGGGDPTGGLPGGGNGGSNGGTELTGEEMDRADVSNTARFFVGMLGTYSSDAKFQNIIDVKPMMTYKMQNWADDFIKRNISTLEGDKESVTTQVVGVNLDYYSSRSVTAEVKTMKNKVNNSGQKMINENAIVKLVKIGDKWLVDSLNWE
jgi:hypothetical protein